jgi:S-(hydroxymethyl)glutathione dehydrogenase/alcohol dehydrogenase
MQFRAAILEAPGQNLVIDTVETGPLRPQDVLVRIGAAGICHTDLEVIAGQLVYPMPIVLGHEAAGAIVDVGDGTSRSRIGERVVLS